MNNVALLYLKKLIGKVDSSSSVISEIKNKCIDLTGGYPTYRVM